MRLQRRPVRLERLGRRRSRRLERRHPGEQLPGSRLLLEPQGTRALEARREGI
jgi:hypothetical protein